MKCNKVKTWLENEFWFPQKFKLRIFGKKMLSSFCEVVTFVAMKMRSFQSQNLMSEEKLF